MSSPEAFVGDACDHPDDPGRRLIFADWCEEYGDDDRAEFIRLQVRLEDVPEWDPERFDLEERAGDLLAAHRAEWLGDLPVWARREPIEFRRGLPGEIRLPPSRFLSHGGRLTQSLPLIRLTLDGLNNRAGELARTEWINRVAELELLGVAADTAHLRDFMKHFRSERIRHLGLKSKTRGQVGPNDSLSAWPGLERLTSLALRHGSFDDARLAKLLGSAKMGELQRLDLSHTAVGPRTCTALATNERLAGLRHLDLSGSEIKTGELLALARAGWHRLESLRTSLSRQVSDATLEEVARAPWVGGLASLSIGPSFVSPLVAHAAAGRLRHLEVGWGGTGDRFAALFDSDHAEGLRSLTIYGQSSAAGLPLLTSSPKLSGLVRLTFGSCIGRTDLLCGLIESPHLAAVRELTVFGCPMTPQGAARLPRLDGLSRLRSLSLDNCFLADQHVAALARSPHLKDLRRLDLSRNNLSDAGLLALLNAPWAPSLRELRLFCTQITSAGVAALASSPALANLRVLELDHHVVGQAAAEGLAESPHLTKLLRLRVYPKRPNGILLLRERFGGVLILE